MRRGWRKYWPADPMDTGLALLSGCCIWIGVGVGTLAVIAIVLGVVSGLLAMVI